MEIAGTKAKERERNRERGRKIYLLREARVKREKEKQGGDKFHCEIKQISLNELKYNIFLHSYPPK